MSYNDFIKRGLQGYNEGISFGLPRLENFIHGLLPGMYYLIGGESGTNKTMLLDFMLTNVMNEARAKQDVRVFGKYFSLENSYEQKMTRLICSHAKQKYSISLDPSVVSGYRKQKLSTEQLRVVERCKKEVEDSFELTSNQFEFIFESFSVAKIEAALYRLSVAHGSWSGEGVANESKVYTRNNPKDLIIIAIDHIGLIEEEGKQSLKQAIDEVSKLFVAYKRNCGFTFIALQQFNDSLEHKVTSKGELADPSRDNFKDSRNTYQDADVVFGLMNPYNKGLLKYKGYDLDGAGEPTDMIGPAFRLIKVIKSRVSADSLNRCVVVDAEAGLFRELPSPDEMSNNRQLYNDIFKLYVEPVYTK